MTELLANAVQSIQLGIEDYQSNDARRPISAVRNFHAGVLLLGKQCLLNAAPEADPMEILASRFVPVPDGDGGVVHKPKGYHTLDLGELKERFKDFGLAWPSGDIVSLQKLRNEFEHYHSAAPKEAIRQTIASCFPIIGGFFAILQLSPSETLGEAWAVMLAEEAFFAKQKSECDATFAKLPWSDELSATVSFSCPSCHSSLIFQEDAENEIPEYIKGRCKACGRSLSSEETVTLIVTAQYGSDDYVSVKDGGEHVIHDCRQCWNATYVTADNVNTCFWCGYEVTGECGRCGASLDIENLSTDNSDLCDYCAHVMSKDD